MVDALGTLGEPVLDRTLGVNILHGLNEQYSHMAAMISTSVSHILMFVLLIYSSKK